MIPLKYLVYTCLDHKACHIIQSAVNVFLSRIITKSRLLLFIVRASDDREVRRVLKRNDSLSLRAENPEAVISRRGSVQHIRSESPPTSTKRSPLRNSFLDVSGHRLRLGASNEMRSRSNAESSPPLATASLDCTVDTAGSYPTTKYSAFWPPSLQRRLDGTHVRGESLTIPLGSTSTTTNGGASDSCPSLAEVLSNNSEPPFDLKSFLRFAKRQVITDPRQ